ncbi:fringe glycosyltransferase [Plutella xylostella]|uniref:fringe glycosyltransferase n=1 Tax=Plutella xylostella TaxID=51655 RepID=UPI0020327390|nr:fringe glycosyltransferase [Plutella xylostella]
MKGLSRIKSAVALLAIGYCSFLVYQGGVSSNLILQVSRPAAVQFDEDANLVERTESVVTKNASGKESVDKSVNSESEQNKNITLDDIFIGVKTTRYNQKSRLPVILKTWFQLAKNQTWFFTDIDNPLHQYQTNGHMVDTKCSPLHERQHLCCKTAVEYDHFINSGKKWFCHFDDDNYVNVPRLVEELRKYDPMRPWYLGRTSVFNPMLYPENETESGEVFWFATFGAGMCMSRSLALQILPVTGGGRFISICNKLRYPDDVTMGYIVGRYGKVGLTVVPQFHSHYEELRFLPADSLRDQLSLSYELQNRKGRNVLDVPGFNTVYDPTRFMSLHCFLFPNEKFCPR